MADAGRGDEEADGDGAAAPPASSGAGRHAGPARTSPYPVSRLSAPHDLISMAEEIQAADRMVASVTGGRLEEIARQIRQLQAQAADALEQARRATELHRASCNFKKRPGAVYHLYRRPDGQCYFSMLSPDDWGGKPPHPHDGSYRLEADMGWTPAGEVAARDAERAQARRLLSGG